MYYVVLWIESTHNLPHLHKMCTGANKTTRKLKQEQIVTCTHDTCVRRFDGLVKRECQAFYYYRTTIHIYRPFICFHINLFFSLSFKSMFVCVYAAAKAPLCYCSFTMFFEIMLHIRNSCKHKICMLPKHNKMHYVKWPKIDNSRKKMDSWTCNMSYNNMNSITTE